MSRDWRVMAVEDMLIEIEWEGWNVKTDWPKRGRADEVKVIMSVRYNGIGGGNVMHRKRINIMSTSAVEAVRRLMSNVDSGHERADLMYFLNDVTQEIESWYEQGKAAVNPDPTKVRSKTPWLMHPIWPAAGVTGIAAAPGTFKSFMAQAIALSLHHATPLLTRNTSVKEPKSILFLDWEADADTFARRLRALQKGNGLPVEPVLTYKQMTTRLADAAVGLQELIMEREFDGIVVDSMSAGIGAGMKEDDSVNGFYDAVHFMGVPALVLAHKSIEHQRNRTPRFFGSGMSEARVRMAWNAEATDDQDFVKWQCFKDNNHGLAGRELAWEIEMESKGKGEDRHLKRVGFLGTNPENVMLEDGGSAGQLTKEQEIRKLLAIEGPMKRDQIGQGLGMTRSQVDTAMRPDRTGDSFVRLDDGRWRNR